MDVRTALKSQYHAALKTLHEVIEKCPDVMWNDAIDGAAPFWRVRTTRFSTPIFTYSRIRRRLLPGRGIAMKLNTLAVFLMTTNVNPRLVNRSLATSFSNTATLATA